MRRAGLTSGLALAVVALSSLPALAQSESPRGGGGGERTGAAVPRGSGGGGGAGSGSGGGSGAGVGSSSSSASTPSSTGSGGVAGGRDRGVSRSAPERRHAPATRAPGSREGSARSRVAPGGSSSEPNAIGPERVTPEHARARGDRPAVSSAVPREQFPTYPVYPVYPIYPGYPGGGYYYPGYWGFGAFFYDPWWWHGGYSGYPYGGGGGGYSGSAYYGDYGKLRLKVKPREAEVYVDGYYSGTVDQFDGVFQRLTLRSGAHRIEIRRDGYVPLSFEVLIAPDETVTYTGELKPLR